MEQQDLNKRLILALVLSFFVFAGYAYLFPQQEIMQPAKQEQSSKVTNTASPATPQLANKSNAAPVTASTAQADNKTAPTVTSNVKNLLTITSNIYKMSIDQFARISDYELLEEKYKDEEGKNLHIIAVDKVKPLEIRFSDIALNEEAFKTKIKKLGYPSIDDDLGTFEEIGTKAKSFVSCAIGKMDDNS